MPKVSRFVSDSVTTLLLSIFNRGLGIGVGVVLARYLGPAGKGYVAYAPIGLELFISAMNGIAQAITMQYGQSKIPGSAVHAAMLRIVAGASVPGAIALAAFALLVPSQHVLIYAAVALPFAIYATTGSGLLIGADRIAATNVQRTIISSGFNAVTVALVVLFHADYRIVLTAWVVSYAAAAVYTYAASRPFIGGSAPVTREIVREQITYGSTAGLAQLAGYANMRIDVVVVSLMLGARELGFYTLAVGLAEMIWQLSSPLCFAAFPRIAIDDPERAVAFTARLIRHILAIVVPIGVFCFIAGPPLISLLYGRTFAPAGDAVRWILPGVVAYAVEVPLGYYLLVRLRRPWTIVVIQSISVVLCAALAAILIKPYGIDGAAAATSITYVGVVIVKGLIFARTTGTHPRRLLLIERDDAVAIRRMAAAALARVRPSAA